MNNAFRTLFAFSTIGLSSVFANQLEPIHITVPFAFTAGKTNLPAGDYTVVEQDSKVILIKGATASAFVLGSAAGDGLQDKAGLSFSHTNKGYFLKEVHSWGRPSSIVPMPEAVAKQ